MAEEHAVVTWLRTRLGYRATTQGASVSLYPEDVVDLVYAVDAYMGQHLRDMDALNADRERALRSEIIDLQNKLIGERANVADLQLKLACERAEKRSLALRVRELELQAGTTG